MDVGILSCAEKLYCFSFSDGARADGSPLPAPAVTTRQRGRPKPPEPPRALLVCGCGTFAPALAVPRGIPPTEGNYTCAASPRLGPTSRAHKPHTDRPSSPLPPGPGRPGGA